MDKIFRFLLNSALTALLVLICPVALAQVTVAMAPSIDNTIYAESNNSNAKGEGMFVGMDNLGMERRALLAFEDLSTIPVGSTITSVSLQISADNGSAAPITMSVFEVTHPWGEGTSNGAGNGALGFPPTPTDATWVFAMMPSFINDRWATPGGDYLAPPLATSQVAGGATVSFLSSSEFVATVQAWLDGSRENLGLILLADAPISGSVRRLATRENTVISRRPSLSITYTTTNGAERPLVASGLWFDASQEGDGFNLIESPSESGNAITVFYFGYDGAGSRLWLVSDTVTGPLMTNTDLQFSMLAGGMSGNFLAPAPSSELTPWGTLTVNLTECGVGTFFLDGADGSKTFAASQLAGVDGVSCVALAR